MRIKELRILLKNKLPGIEVHKTFSPLRNYRLKTSELRVAAVAIHFKVEADQLVLILIKRTRYKGAHSQQIAFPGGKKESSDVDLEYTARRESEEEIGIPVTSGECLGRLTPVNIPVSLFHVTPYVFFHEKFPKLMKEEREVQEIIICPIKEVDTFNLRTKQTVTAKPGLELKDVPGIRYKNDFIWGATALILHEFNCLIKMSESKKRNKP